MPLSKKFTLAFYLGLGGSYFLDTAKDWYHVIPIWNNISKNAHYPNQTHWTFQYNLGTELEMALTSNMYGILKLQAEFEVPMEDALRFNDMPWALLFQAGLGLGYRF